MLGKNKDNVSLQMSRSCSPEADGTRAAHTAASMADLLKSMIIGKVVE